MGMLVRSQFRKSPLMRVTVFNKLAVGAFPLACSLVAVQMSAAVPLLLTFGWQHMHIGSSKDALRWCRVVPLFVATLLTSTLALKDAPMSLIITFRALSPICALIVERSMKTLLHVGYRTIASIILICCGVALYVRDLNPPERNSTTWYAIGWVMLNTALGIADRIFQRVMLSKDQVPVDISTVSAALLNNLLGIPLIFVAAVFAGETPLVHDVVNKMSALDVQLVVLSCIVGTGISFSGIWVQGVVSATSMMMLTNANKFLILLLEMFVLPGSSGTWNQCLGAFISVMGSIFYALSELDSVQAPKGASNRAERMPLLVGYAKP
eukprot:TRINITY_DN34814_c0_g1_i1.p1 TRINITY_DN34814_c0_g1~~TRINITY_DN34814_c0_g1_i1.p1  ORF type:complete len:324 (+),score=54.55 TRINITY_DN34814_c0_g1_i1:167-1138(+)